MNSQLRFEKLPVTRAGQNGSIVWDLATMRGALINAGSEAERVLMRLRHHGIALEKLLVTHGHVDRRELVRSIREKLFPLGDDLRFVPGHSEMSTFGYEQQYNPYVGDDAIKAVLADGSRTIAMQTHQQVSERKNHEDL